MFNFIKNIDEILFSITIFGSKDVYIIVYILQLFIVYCIIISICNIITENESLLHNCKVSLKEYKECKIPTTTAAVSAVEEAAAATPAGG